MLTYGIEDLAMVDPRSKQVGHKGPGPWFFKVAVCSLLDVDFYKPTNLLHDDVT